MWQEVTATLRSNGENFKPLLADAVYSSKNVDVLNYVNITDLLTENGRVYGAVGFSIMEETAYVIHAQSSSDRNRRSCGPL